MKNKLYMVAGLAILVVAFASFGVYARSLTGKNQSLSCDKADLLGTLVKDSTGHVIGFVYRVETDGDQSFAIINHEVNPYYGEWEEYTPVPVGTLKMAKFSKKESNLMTVVLNKTEKQLEAAPIWDPAKMNDHTFQAKIDKYFGAQPSLG